MIVLIRGRPSMRVCSRTQGCARQGCCARECEQGMREHQQPNQHSRQRASDPFEKIEVARRKVMSGRVQAGRQGAFRDPWPVYTGVGFNTAIRNTRKRARAKGVSAPSARWMDRLVRMPSVQLHLRFRAPRQRAREGDPGSPWPSRAGRARASCKARYTSAWRPDPQRANCQVRKIYYQ